MPVGVEGAPPFPRGGLFMGNAAEEYPKNVPAHQVLEEESPEALGERVERLRIARPDLFHKSSAPIRHRRSYPAGASLPGSDRVKELAWKLAWAVGSTYGEAYGKRTRLWRWADALARRIEEKAP